MNVMCDRILFVVVVLVSNESSTIFDNYLMHHVLIRFGLYHLVVLDDDNPFKGSFNTMCQVLLLN